MPLSCLPYSPFALLRMTTQNHAVCACATHWMYQIPLKALAIAAFEMWMVLAAASNVLLEASEI